MNTKGLTLYVQQEDGETKLEATKRTLTQHFQKNCPDGLQFTGIHMTGVTENLEGTQISVGYMAPAPLVEFDMNKAKEQQNVSE